MTALHKHIAAKLNRDPRRQNGVTAEQVARVDSGTERTVSHPISAGGCVRSTKGAQRHAQRIRSLRFRSMTGYKGIAVPNKFFYPDHVGKRIVKPKWWYALIAEEDMHARIRKIADKRAKELACFGGQ